MYQRSRIACLIEGTEVNEQRVKKGVNEPPILLVHGMYGLGIIFLLTFVSFSRVELTLKFCHVCIFSEFCRSSFAKSLEAVDDMLKVYV